jgi:TRAP-type uncharacterized transport system substrate-binding protein
LEQHQNSRLQSLRETAVKRIPRLVIPGHRRFQLAVLRIGFVAGLMVLIGLIFAAIDLRPDFSAMEVTLLSGPEGGEDYALAARIAKAARDRRGKVVNVVTEGMAANLAMLSNKSGRRRPDFALALDGLSYPRAERLELVARLPDTRTLFMLALKADAVRTVADLAGLRIGIGPTSSGTYLVAREIFRSEALNGLGATLSDHTMAEQIRLLLEHKLDLGLFLVDSDSPLVHQALREGLHMVSLDNAEALAARIAPLRTATIHPGQIDLVRGLPRTAKKTFQMGLLMLTNRGVSRSHKIEMLSLMDAAFKGFIDLNRNTENHTGLPEVADLKAFVRNGGPSVFEEYAPRLLDYMPPANLLHYVVLVSLLFNGMTLWHRFRLWRIDHQRIQLEDKVLALFDRNYTVMEIALLTPKAGDFGAERRRTLDDLIDASVALRQRIRRYSVAMIVPMGAEMYYRNQESLVDSQLQALRRFRDRLDRLGRGPLAPEPAGGEQAAGAGTESLPRSVSLPI